MSANVHTEETSVDARTGCSESTLRAFKSDASTDFATSPNSATQEVVLSTVGHPGPSLAKLTRDNSRIVSAPPRPTTPCWEWTGNQNRNGYGRVRAGGRREMAHRAVYELFRGPIPEGLQADHTCRNRACCNPQHIEIVDGLTNNLRGAGPAAQNARKTACPKGHPYDTGNTYVDPKGTRHCRKCRRARGVEAYRRAAERQVLRETRTAKPSPKGVA